MTLGGVAFRNVFRNKFRNILTIAGVAVAILGFVMLRTVLYAWTMGAEFAAKDRIGSRHKVTFVMTLPKKYVDDIQTNIKSVKAVTWANWVGAKIPGHEKEFFATLAVDHATYFEVYDEAVVTPEVKKAWMSERQCAVAGEKLAKKFEWKVGDKITLTSPIYQGDIPVTLCGTYVASRKSIDNSTLVIRWDYMNDLQPERRKDQVGWIVSRVDDPAHVADISAAIDKLFDDRDIQTLSMSERAMQMSFLGMLSAVLKAIDVVSIVILAIMMLILGNTIAMGVRERTNEYGVLRAIGFFPRHIVTFVLGEAATIGLGGGLLGLLLAYPLVEKGMGRFIEENLGAYFPYFRIADETAIAAPLLALGLALVAAAFPAYRASQLKVVDALRRLG
jgi:putative ABC transport system permease protein